MLTRIDQPHRYGGHRNAIERHGVVFVSAATVENFGLTAAFLPRHDEQSFG